MDYLLYFFYNAWPAYISVSLILFGIYLYRLPYLVQPVHGFRFRSVFACLLMIGGIIGIACAIILGQGEISQDQYKKLTEQAKDNPQIAKIIKSQASDKITRFQLKKINRQIHFLKLENNEAKKELSSATKNIDTQ